MQLKKILIGLLFAASSVHAGDAIVSWTYPTTYEDGTVLPIAEITDVTIYYGQTAAGPYTATKVVVPPATTTTITNLAKGTWYFTATVTSTNGLDSAQSIVVNKSVLGTSKPKAPTLR